MKEKSLTLSLAHTHTHTHTHVTIVVCKNWTPLASEIVLRQMCLSAEWRNDVCARGFLHRGADNEELAERIYFWE